MAGKKTTKKVVNSKGTTKKGTPKKVNYPKTRKTRSDKGKCHDVDPKTVGRPKRTYPDRPADDWKEVFITALTETGNVGESCKIAGISRPAALDHKADDPAFAEAWETAWENAKDNLEMIARKRAEEKSDYLMALFLKNRCGFRDQVSTEISGKEGGRPIEFKDVNMESQRNTLIGLLEGMRSALQKQDEPVDAEIISIENKKVS